MIDPSKYKMSFIPKENAVFWVVSLTICGSLIVVLNLATILAFLTNRTLQRRSVYCLINLAIADLLYGFIGNIYGFCVYSFVTLNLDLDPTFSILVFLCTVCTLMASILSLATVSLERFCAFFFPFRHRVIRLRVYIAVFVVSWVIAIIDTLLLKFLYHTGLVLNYVLMALSVIMIFSSYAAIFMKVKKDNQQEIQNQPSFSQRRQIQETKLAKTLCIVTVLSIITWVPYIAFRFSYLNFDQDDLLMKHPNIYSLMILVQRMNSVVNPIVYLFRMRDFRKALLQLLCRCSCNCNTRVDAYPVGNRNEII